jgi:hypothetical protein
MATQCTCSLMSSAIMDTKPQKNLFQQWVALTFPLSVPLHQRLIDSMNYKRKFVKSENEQDLVHSHNSFPSVGRKHSSITSCVVNESVAYITLNNSDRHSLQEAESFSRSKADSRSNDQGFRHRRFISVHTRSPLVTIPSRMIQVHTIIF